MPYPAPQFHEPQPAPLPFIASLPIAPGRTGTALAGFAPLFAHGLRLYCLDAGNVFDPKPLGLQLRMARCDPSGVLDSQVFVSRAFTCYQLLTAAENLLPPLLELDTPAVAVILAVEHMFIDDDIREKERRHLFARLLRTTRQLSGEGLSILLSYAPDNRATSWVRQLRREVQPLPDMQQSIERIGRAIHGTHTTDL